MTHELDEVVQIVAVWVLRRRKQFYIDLALIMFRLKENFEMAYLKIMGGFNNPFLSLEKPIFFVFFFITYYSV